MKKKQVDTSRIGWCKIMRVMKITFVFVFFFAMSISASTYSQQTRLSLNMDNASIKSIFNAIESQSEFIFFYEDKQVNLDRHVKLDVKEEKLENVLSRLFENSDIQYTIIDRQVVISKKEMKTSEVSVMSEAIQNGKIQVKGLVLDNSQPMPGVSVVIKGTTIGTITDGDGRFTISGNVGDIILFSFVGFEPSKHIIKKAVDNLVIKLAETSVGIEDVTVVAYGVQKKATLTGAISSIGTEALLKSPSGSVANSLAGQLTGISSVQVSGQPGNNDAKIFVRGVGSLTEDGAQPLILVDGVERSFFQMDPNEIESINVLKDASATAVFGVRGANGVILVTTKRGIEGKTQISVSSSVGVQMPTRILKYADSYTYATCYNEMQRNDGVPEDKLTFTAYDIERFRLGDEPIMYPSIDWMDYLLNDAAVQSQHNINISGGTKNVRYFTSVGYLFEDGMFKKLDGLDYDNNYSYKRYNYRANLDVDLTPTTTFKMNIGGILGARKEPIQEIWKQFTWSAPFSSPGIIDGKKMLTFPTRYPGIEMANVVLDRYYGTGTKRFMSNTMSFDLSLTQKLDEITKGLSADIKGSYNTNYIYSQQVNGYAETYTPFYYSELMNPGLKVGDPGFDKTIVYRLSGQSKEKSWSINNDDKKRGRNWYLEGSLRYNRKFGLHNLGGLFLYNQTKKYYPKQYSDVPTAYIGFAGRLTYDYKSRYMAEFNIGRNGSENFSPDKRFGTFPAGSVGYILSDEPFFPKSKIVTYLKLRGSVGLVGNDNMSDNRFLYLPDSYAINSKNGLSTSYADYNGYVFGLTNTVYEAVAYELRLGNPYVTWETALKQNYGIDANLFDDKLKVSADYFRENRKDILIQRQTIPSLVSLSLLPGSSSGGLLPVVNMGKVDNHGYEISLKWNDQIKDINYHVDANASYSMNKIVFMDEVETNEPYMRRTGHPVGAQFGYVSQGFYTKADFDEAGNLVAGLPVPLGKVYPGDIKYADLNDDDIIDGDDTKMVGNPKRPAYTFGLNMGVDYKGFSASMNWTGAAKCDIMMGNAFMRPFYQGQSLYQYQADNRWTEETAATAEFPRFSNVVSNPNAATSRVWLRDVSYIKLKNVAIGYNITNKRILKTLGASQVSVNLTGYNLLTIDKLKIFDPEGELTRDNNTYPITKIYSLGVNVTF